MSYVGFTGSRNPPSLLQAGVLGIELCQLLRADVTLGHGDCVNSDALAHDLAYGLGYRIDVHPPTIDTWRAHRVGYHMHDPTSYPARNARIVHLSDRLLALPCGPEVVSGSGTWMTVRMARRKGIPIRIIWPDGSHTDEGDWL